MKDFTNVNSPTLLDKNTLWLDHLSELLYRTPEQSVFL